MRRAAMGLAICLIVVGCSSDDDSRSGAATTVESETSQPPDPDPVTAVPEPTPATSSAPRTSAPAALPPTSSSGPAATSAPPDPTTFGELGETDAVITGDRGMLQIGDVDLPAALDTNFPLPDDLSVLLASEVDDSLGFTGSTALAFDDAVQLYRVGLAAAGYSVEEGQFIDGVVAVFAFDGPNGMGDVVLSSSPRGGTDVIVTFES